MRGKTVVRVSPTQVKTPFFMRWSFSDRMVLGQIIRDQESLVEDISRYRTIVDLGANFGASSILYAEHAPEARIISVEPEHENFRLLEMNAELYPSIIPFNSGVWYRSGTLSLANPNSDSWAFVFEETTGETEETDNVVPAITIPDLLSHNKTHPPVLFKIDIEGSEFELFSTNHDSWIRHVDTFLIETHDRFKPGCTDRVRNALRGSHEFSGTSGEYMIFRKAVQSER